jgi:hypothetical protein
MKRRRWIWLVILLIFVLLAALVIHHHGKKKAAGGSEAAVSGTVAVRPATAKADRDAPSGEVPADLVRYATTDVAT